MSLLCSGTAMLPLLAKERQAELQERQSNTSNFSSSTTSSTLSLGVNTTTTNVLCDTKMNGTFTLVQSNTFGYPK